MNKTSSDDTRITHGGTRHHSAAGAINPPLVRASTVSFENWAALRASVQDPFDGFFYGRFGTPTHFSLADALCELADGDAAVFFPSGLAAVVGTILAFVESGDHILVVDCVYEPTRKFCDTTLASLGVEVEYFAPDEGAGIAQRFRERTRLVLCESPGSLSMECQDIPAIAAAARAAGEIMLAVDNTYATPLNCPVLKLGADIDIQAATKYIAGHADLLLGAAICNSRAGKAVQRCALRFGYCASPDDAWQALRGLRSLGVRMRQHECGAAEVAAWLAAQPELLRMLRPGSADDSSAELFTRDHRGGNGLFSIELEHHSDAALAAMVDGFKLFKLGFSWGGFESLILPFDLQGARSFGDWSGRGSLLRLHIGLEHPADLIADLDAGFTRLRAAR